MVWSESWSSVHDLGSRHPSNALETSGSKHWPHWIYSVNSCRFQCSLNLTPTQALQLRALTWALAGEQHLLPPALPFCWRLTPGAKGATRATVQCLFSDSKLTVLIYWLVPASFKLQELRSQYLFAAVAGMITSSRRETRATGSNTF